MSDKTKSGKPEATKDEVKPTAAAAVVATSAPEEDESPDEKDLAELEAARLADKPAATVTAPEPEAEVEMEEDSPEVAALKQAFKAFDDKIAAHEKAIADKKVEIENHETAITKLKDTLRTKFGGLVGQMGGVPVRSGPGRKPGPAKQQTAKPDNGGTRQRTNYGDGNSTGDLIAACLKKSKKPVNSEQIVAYLKQHNNTTNPSVELSRMVGKGIVTRPQRGYYEWSGE